MNPKITSSKSLRGLNFFPCLTQELFLVRGPSNLWSLSLAPLIHLNHTVLQMQHVIKDEAQTDHKIMKLKKQEKWKCY